MEKNQKMNKPKRLLLINNKRVVKLLLKKTLLSKLKLTKMEMNLKSNLVLFSLMSTNNNRRQLSRTSIQLARLKLVKMETKLKNNQMLFSLILTKILRNMPCLLQSSQLPFKLKLRKKKILIHYLKNKRDNNLLNPLSRKKLRKQMVTLDLTIMMTSKIQISVKLKMI